MPKKVNEIITSKIIEELEKGEIPWKKPWIVKEQKNYISKKEYTGINQFMLSIIADQKGYKSKYWLTFNQIKKLKGELLKGSKASPVIYWQVKEEEKEKKEDKKKTFLILRYYNVFNADCIKGIDFEIEKTEVFNPVEKAEKICNSYLTREKIKYENKGNSAYYSPQNDNIVLPPKDQFLSKENYYSTLYHEMTHSTGNKKRLNRFDKEQEKTHLKGSYAKEELIAEIGACLLSAKTNLFEKNLKNSSAYLQSWLNALKADSSLIISASSKANKAINLILAK